MNARLIAVGAAVLLVASAASAQTPPPQAAPPAAAPAAQALPFPEGAQVAYIAVERVASESIEGKASQKRVQDAQQAKLKQLEGKSKALESAQARTTQAGSSDEDKALAQKEVERLQVDLQRAQQDAQGELDELQAQVNADFERKLGPVIQQLVGERKVMVLLSREATGLIWVAPALDLTSEVIKRFDAAVAAAPPAPPKPPTKN